MITNLEEIEKHAIRRLKTARKSAIIAHHKRALAFVAEVRRLQANVKAWKEVYSGCHTLLQEAEGDFRGLAILVTAAKDFDKCK